MKRVLITGGAGFIGTNLVSYITDKTDWKIRVLDNLSTGSLEDLRRVDNFDEERTELIEGDIRNKGEVENAVKGSDYIVNLAAQTGVMPSIEDPVKDAKVNILGLLNLLEVSREENVERVLHASSAAPLGEQEPPLDEGKVPEPLAPYGASKLAGEGYCSAYAGSFGLNTVVLRFSNVYGPHSEHKSSVVHKFIKKIIDGKELVVYGDGEQTRDYIHTEDICQGIYLALENEMENDFELFQMGTGRETSINELIEILKEESSENGLEVENVVHEEEREGEIKKNYADISKIMEQLGYEPSYSLKKGIKETFDWYLKNY